MITNEEIEDFLEEKGFEFENCGDLRGESDVVFYNNHRKRIAVVTDYRSGGKSIFVEVDKLS